jgi:hypothetical protein
MRFLLSRPVFFEPPEEETEVPWKQGGCRVASPSEYVSCAESVREMLSPFSSFPRKRESSSINQSWAPASEGATVFLIFYEFIILE